MSSNWDVDIFLCVIYYYCSSTSSNGKILDGSSRVSTGALQAVIFTSFHKSYEILINDSHLLTHTYQNEIRKWQLKQYNTKLSIKLFIYESGHNHEEMEDVLCT
jgi:hypothetical protein